MVIVGIWFLRSDKKSDIQSMAIGEFGTINLPTTPTPDNNRGDFKEGTLINNLDEKKVMQATLHTNMGDIEIEFFEQDAPKTVENFIKLAKEGFYDGVKFHRVIKDFMIQAGDPNSKDDTKMSLWGQGGPGYTVPAEIKIKHTKGTVATARLSDQVNPLKASSGSQFFINAKDNPFLDDNYTVFGKVVSGMEVVTKIENAATGANDIPLTAVVINNITLK